LIWTGQRSVELGLADGFGSLEYVAREVVKAEEIRDFTITEGVFDKVAKRFGAAFAGALAETLLRYSAGMR
jgi:protease-4